MKRRHDETITVENHLERISAMIDKNEDLSDGGFNLIVNQINTILNHLLGEQLIDKNSYHTLYNQVTGTDPESIILAFTFINHLRKNLLYDSKGRLQRSANHSNNGKEYLQSERNPFLPHPNHHRLINDAT